jgi:Domain of unknown function (DUF4178)
MTRAKSPPPGTSRRPAPGRPRVLSCPSCGGSVRIRANGISITVICAACGSTLDVVNPDVRLIAEAQQRTREPPIRIGKRATLAGTEWEVVGFQNRSDTVNGWRWDEYLLFNPYRGFRFLAQDDEDWTLYCMLREDVADPEQGFGGRRFTLRSTGIARTEYVLGEFYWRARAGDEVAVSEYIDAPYVLSREQGGEEIIWSRGVQLPAATIRTAFGLAADIVPATSGDKVWLRRAHTRGVRRIAVVAIVVLLLAHMITFGTSRSAVLFTQTFHTTAADKGHILTTTPFVIPEKRGNLRITATSPVLNNWVQLGLSLAGPGDVTFNAAPSIEYYEGVDSDGAWSEGAQSADVTFAAVPGGSYRLLIEPYAGAYAPDPTREPSPWASDGDVEFSVTVTRHVPSGWNFWLALLLLVSYPIYRILADRGLRGPPGTSP